MADVREINLPTVSSIGSSDFVRVVEADGTSAKITKSNLLSGTTFWTDYVLVVDQKSAGTDGGTATSGSWFTRTLNTEAADTGNIASIASNQITIPAGTYRIYAVVPGIRVNRHQARLYNVTGSAVIMYGSAGFTPNAGSVGGRSDSLITGLFTISVTTAIRIEQQVETTNATIGLGVSGNFGGTERYTQVELWKQ